MRERQRERSSALELSPNTVLHIYKVAHWSHPRNIHGPCTGTTPFFTKRREKIKGNLKSGHLRYQQYVYLLESRPKLIYGLHRMLYTGVETKVQKVLHRMFFFLKLVTSNVTYGIHIK